ncbi:MULTISPECIES: tetratricopeptide repeat protein [Kordiimonas]|jgi:Flp pilus assembly protein TadD|uniref:tetratricopeptide repeat protein n=1 Tax=Kordiimonas TaxID=288021 RepID=UPI00257FB933|nr:tetratricopeptide repeat protein [Kordiimonas sp. UBA4487]
MLKILSNRIKFIPLLLLAACAAGGPEKRVNHGEGPVSARARNTLASEDPAGLVTVAEGFERAGNLEGAYNLYSQAAAADPNLMAAKLGISRVLAKTGRLDQAQAILDNLGQQFPDALELKLTQVDVAIMRADYAVADAELSTVITPDTTDLTQLILAGQLAQVTGNARRARIMFDRALVVAPSHPGVIRNMALSFALEGEFETAVALLQKTLDMPASVTPSKRSLALVYALSGQKKAAQVIAGGATDESEFQRMSVAFDLLPRLNKSEQAALLMFDHLPRDIMQR